MGKIFENLFCIKLGNVLPSKRPGNCKKYSRKFEQIFPGIFAKRDVPYLVQNKL